MTEDSRLYCVSGWRYGQCEMSDAAQECGCETSSFVTLVASRAKYAVLVL